MWLLDGNPNFEAHLEDKVQQVSSTFYLVGTEDSPFHNTYKMALVCVTNHKRCPSIFWQILPSYS